MFGVTKTDDRGSVLIGCRDTEKGAETLRLGDAIATVANCGRYPGMRERVLKTKVGDDLLKVLTKEEAHAVAKVALCMYVIERIA
jgi:hypothetical protein